MTTQRDSIISTPSRGTGPLNPSSLLYVFAIFPSVVPSLHPIPSFHPSSSSQRRQIDQVPHGGPSVRAVPRLLNLRQVRHNLLHLREGLKKGGREGGRKETLVNTCVTLNVYRYHPFLRPPLPPSLLPCFLSYLRFSQGLPNHN